MIDDTQTTGVEAPAQTADTVEAPTSEAGAQVNNEAPQAAAVEEPTVNATDTAEEKLYAGKYKSVEDMEKAYTELTSKFTTTAQEKAELSRILNESFITPQPAQAATTEDVFGEEADPVNQEIEQLKKVTAVQSFVMTHQDADAAAMQQVLTTDPLVKQINGHEAKLEYAYLRSQSMSQSKAIAEAEKKGAQSAQAKIAEKQVAQVETAQQSSAPIDENAELREQMQSGSLAEREAARRAYIKKNLVNL